MLAEAMSKGRPIDLADLRKAIVRPMNTPADPSGNDVSLEMEIGEMLKNGTMSKTYMRLLAKLYRQIELAIQG